MRACFVALIQDELRLRTCVDSHCQDSLTCCVTYYRAPWQEVLHCQLDALVFQIVILLFVLCSPIEVKEIRLGLRAQQTKTFFLLANEAADIVLCLLNGVLGLEDALSI